MAKIVVEKIQLEAPVILEYLPNGAKEHDEYKVLATFESIKEAKKWIKENPERVEELISKFSKYGVLCLTSIRTCYIVEERRSK